MMKLKLFTKLIYDLIAIALLSFMPACDKEKVEPENSSSIKSQIIGKWEGKFYNYEADATGYVGFEFKAGGKGSMSIGDDEWVNVFSGKYTISGEMITLFGTYSEGNNTENYGVDLEISYLTNKKLMGMFNIYFPDYEEEDFWLGVELTKVNQFHWE